MNILTNARVIEPQSLSRTATRLSGEWVVISFPGGWREERGSKITTVYSPTNETRADLACSRRFKTLAAFEKWLFSSVHFQYRQAGDAIVLVPYKQVGLDRRFAVNRLDIVIREFACGGNQNYLGVAAVRLQNYSASVLFRSRWDAIAGIRKVFENSVKSIRLISL
jgi:hypothetical protein